jgi:hypothetical protein
MTPAFVTGALLPRSGLVAGTLAVSAEPARFATGTTTYAPLEIYASKHAQLKAAKKSNRNRPKKHRPSDINRTPITHHPEPHLVNGPSPFYTVLDIDAVAVMEARIAAADPDTVITVDHVKALESEIAEKEAKEAAEIAEKRRIARAQSKIDKAAARQVKIAAHKARKPAWDEAIAKRTAASAAYAQEAKATLKANDQADIDADSDGEVTVAATVVETDD